MDIIMNQDSYVIMARILTAACLAGLIGAEREYKRHPAGFRTHLLVGTGACLAMVMALFGFQPYLEENPDISAYDPSRLASYVISGVGFLGAGTIIVQGVSIKGLTTAASIWVVAAIGLAAGAGMYFAAAFTTIMVVLSLFILNDIERFFRSSTQSEKIEVIMDKNDAALSEVIKVLEKENVVVKKLAGGADNRVEQGTKLSFDLHIDVHKAINRTALYEKLMKTDGVLEIEMSLSKDR
ncbi:putative Mg2+ transporter-C (MgtC) family protein [Salibacterium salarium]|uniref:MgtC/SapB family protein n=1 Tax=Salibacterium salarium TaxID=284579 RepID=UPI002785D0FD|nr:MgtC/SapB family protein [Salibacterium salarium]MDQ0300930.1 putative Mg2+ transporter-C (MgtC) family protein [Salibacterium salarium]